MGHWGCTFLRRLQYCFMEFLGFWRSQRLWRLLGVQAGRVRSVYGTLGLDLCGVYRVSSVYGALGWTFRAFLQHLWHLWGVGVVRLALGSCLAFFLFLHAQHRWVPPGLAYWGSGFSQP